MKKYIILFSAVALAISGCDQRFDEINTNPNGITEKNVDPAFLFATGARNCLRAGAAGSYGYKAAAQMAHYYVGVNNDHLLDQYFLDLQGGSYEAPYNSEYQSKLKYYLEIMKLTGPGAEKENPLQYAVTDVLAVLSYAKLTDAYGSIPYFEGGFGNITGELSPKYDPQEVIYPDLIRRLGEDIEVLKQADDGVGLRGQDPIYDNDADKWLRLANSLRLRLAMRMRHVAPQKAQTAITASLSEPLMTDNGHNLAQFNEDGDNSALFSPWYDSFRFWNFRMSDKIISQLVSTNDPRLYIYAKPTGEGTYRGMVNGLTDEEFGEAIKEEYSFPGEYLVGKGAPLYLMTAAEIAFLQAECALFGLGGSDANGHYRRGIELALNRVGVPADSITAFLNRPVATLTGTQEEQFEQIGTQIWLAMAPNFHEAYTYMRRTGYPVIPKRDGVITSLGLTEGELPSRIVYPLSERLRNNANLNEAIAAMPEGDVMTQRLWWDVRR